jgi:tight adherence protein C
MPVLIIVAVAALCVGLASLAFLAFLAVPLGAPTVHLVDPQSTAMPRSTPSVSTSERLVRAAPKGYVGWIERQIVYAGRQADWSAGAFLVIKLIVTLVALGLALPVFLLSPTSLMIGVAVIGLVLALLAPEVMLNSRASDRQTAIRLALPDTLDQMTIAVEAGLGFDLAMSKAATNGRGPLAEELVRTLQDMSIGRSRRDSYRELERRTNSEDLRRFIRAIAQADAYGISIADVLRVQASEMRVRRRQRAEEQALKVPVKIIFPLVFCILPVLFIVVLTPAVIGIVRAFTSL